MPKRGSSPHCRPSPPPQERISIVEHGAKVDLVRVPLDAKEPVEKLNTQEANARGLITQTQAKKLAETNGGLLGTKGKVSVKESGLATHRTSYSFDQTSPKTETIKYYADNRPYEFSAIKRAVTIQGQPDKSKGESVSYESKRLGK